MATSRRATGSVARCKIGDAPAPRHAYLVGVLPVVFRGSCLLQEFRILAWHAGSAAAEARAREAWADLADLQLLEPEAVFPASVVRVTSRRGLMDALEPYVRACQCRQWIEDSLLYWVNETDGHLLAN